MGAIPSRAGSTPPLDAIHRRRVELLDSFRKISSTNPGCPHKIAPVPVGIISYWTFVPRRADDVDCIYSDTPWRPFAERTALDRTDSGFGIPGTAWRIATLESGIQETVLEFGGATRAQGKSRGGLRQRPPSGRISTGGFFGMGRDDPEFDLAGDVLGQVDLDRVEAQLLERSFDPDIFRHRSGSPSPRRAAAI